MAMTSSDSEEGLIGVREAATLVGRNPETIRRWIWSGKLAAIKRGNRHLVSPEEVRKASGERASELTLAEWWENVRKHREEILERDPLLRASQGKISAVEMIREDRERRGEHLMEVIDSEGHARRARN